MTYTFGENIPLDESRGVEFKEIRGNNPVSAIVNTADEYAVAFLNAEGGRILWGVRDSDRLIVGVPLDERQRDRLRKCVADKLNSIQPPITIDVLTVDGRSGGPKFEDPSGPIHNLDNFVGRFPALYGSGEMQLRYTISARHIAAQGALCTDCFD